MRSIRKGLILSSILLALLLAACGVAQTSTAPTTGAAGAGAASAPTADAMAGMDHSTMPGMSTSDAPYDAAFIDSMIMHHEGAITMANQALTQAERPEVKELANAIISAQETEIGQMNAWRTSWYPDLAATGGMGMDMGMMEVPAGATSFDQRFIEAMIPHHQSAVVMAKDALQNAEHPEIKALATAIITAQEAEIAQMQQWLQEWYGITQ